MIAIAVRGEAPPGPSMCSLILRYVTNQSKRPNSGKLGLWNLRAC